MKKVIVNQICEEVCENDLLKDKNDLLQLIHKVAELNGSAFKIELKIREGVTENQTVVYCDEHYANREYTKGYYAFLFMVDNERFDGISYTGPTKKSWFSITITDIKAFSDLLK